MAFENIVGKCEIARNEQFHLFPQCFLTFPQFILIFALIIPTSSADAYNLKERKITYQRKGRFWGMEIPKDNADYRTQEYWDERYKTEESYDWFTDYSSYKHLLVDDVQPSNSILTLGCGNSSLSEQMYHDGFKNITNTDFSPIVINNMAEKHAHLPEMTWIVMDMTQLTFEPCSFDIVLEKGTIDSLLVHEKDPWHISEESLNLIDAALGQVSSILKPGGKFISIAFGQPHFRKPMYARSKYNWSYRTVTFGDAFHFFYYVMVKGERLSEKDLEDEMAHEKHRQEDTSNYFEEIGFIPEDPEDFIFNIDPKLLS